MITHTTDMFGQELGVANDFVISMLSGKRAVMRAGRIVSFEERAKRHVMKVRWYDFNKRTAWVPASGTSTIEIWPERLVKIDIDNILASVID